MLPELLSGQRGTDLTVRVTNRSLEDLQAVLVSSNPYEPGGVRRARIDQGSLGVIAAKVNCTGQAVSLLRPGHREISALASTDGVVIEAAAPSIPVGIDGEAVTMHTPVHRTVRPRVLRIRLPKHRPGVPPPADASNGNACGASRFPESGGT